MQIRQPISDQVWDNHRSGRWKFLAVRQTPGQQTWFCSASSFCAASRQLQIVPRFTSIAINWCIIAQAVPGWLQKCQHSVQWGVLRQDGCKYVIRQLFGETLGYLLDALWQKLRQYDCQSVNIHRQCNEQQIYRLFGETANHPLVISWMQMSAILLVRTLLRGSV